MNGQALRARIMARRPYRALAEALADARLSRVLAANGVPTDPGPSACLGCHYGEPHACADIPDFDDEDWTMLDGSTRND